MSVQTPIELVKDALLAGYMKVPSKEGKILYGEQKDITTKADIDVGQAILDSLKRSSFPLIAYTEEFGKVELHSSPQYSVVFDDIDGSLNYRDGFGMLPHGSILGVFESPDPKFNECLASGYLDFNSGNLFYAVKNQGARLVEGWAKGREEEIQIRTSGRKSISGETFLRFVPDLYMLGGLSQYFVRYGDRAWLGDLRSTAVHLALVVCGSIDILVLGDNSHIPTKRRTGEEIGPGYLLVREAGGAMLDWNGRDLGEDRVALHEKKTFHAVAAATEELGQEFVEEMHRIPEIVEYMKRKIFRLLKLYPILSSLLQIQIPLQENG